MISTSHVVAMIEHWLATPPNSYFGSSYGNNLAEQLLKNTSAFTADAFLAKMKKDIPVLDELGDELNIVQSHEGFERVKVYIQLGDIHIEVKPHTNHTQQDFYHVAAN